MQLSRRSAIASTMAAALADFRSSPGKAQGLARIRVATGFTAMSAGLINVYVGEQLGYARENGIVTEAVLLNGSAQVMLALGKGATDIGLVSPPEMLPLYVKGNLPAIVAFYEYTYPYKFDVVVKPASPIQSYAGLKGKKIGVSNLGSSEYPVTRAVLSLIGIDPDKEVSWIATGTNLSAGYALDRGDIDALAYFDTPFGLIANAGIKMRYLPRPPGIPDVGGLMLGCTRDYLDKHRDLCVACGRTVSMASEYIMANPQAAARAFVEQYPATAPRGAVGEEAVRQTVVAMGRRTSLYRPDHPGRMGQIFEQDWRDEAKFGNFDVKDFSQFYTNELIGEIDDYDHQKIIDAARKA